MRAGHVRPARGRDTARRRARAGHLVARARGARARPRGRGGDARPAGGEGRCARGRDQRGARRAAVPSPAGAARARRSARRRVDSRRRRPAATSAARMPLVVGGRSSGASRTAAATGAAGVLCLAFPRPPLPRRRRRRRRAVYPSLDEVTVPTLVVQGARDLARAPPLGPRRTVVRVSGGSRPCAPTWAVTADAIRAWLPTVIPYRAGARLQRAPRSSS